MNPLHLLSTFLCFTIIVLLSCNAPTFRIFEKPVIFNEERNRLSVEYLQKRHGIETEQSSIEPRMIVVHWTEIPTLEDTWDFFNSPHLDARPDILAASALNVSAHFLVDRDGTIFRLLPDTTFARHTIGLNYMAIGIENIGGSDAPLTRAQLLANEQLVRYLYKRHPIEWVIGHHEYYVFRDSELWMETDPDYLTYKVDPGDRFMKRLRSRLEDLKPRHLP